MPQGAFPRCEALGVQVEASRIEKVAAKGLGQQAAK